MRRVSSLLYCLLITGFFMLPACAATRQAAAHEPTISLHALSQVSRLKTCDDSSFLRIAQVDKNTCDLERQAYEPVCWRNIEASIPGREFQGTLVEREQIQVNLGSLFVYCVQANIMLRGVYKGE